MALDEAVLTSTSWKNLKETDQDRYDELFAQCSISQKRRVQAILAGAQVTAATTAAKPFDARFNWQDWDEMDSPFSENAEAYLDYSPQYWFNYFFQEAKKTKIGKTGENTPVAQSLLTSLTALFNKVELPGFRPAGSQTATPRGFKYVLKDTMRASVSQADAGGGAPHFTFPSDLARQTWKNALLALLKAGFQAAPAAGPLDGSIAGCLLENDLVSQINSDSQEIRVFWRGDGRDSMHTEDWNRSVDEPAAVRKYNLDADWHPYSQQTVKSQMWVRKAQGDNDYYTVVSVTAELETAACFPKVDERRAYQMPLSSPDKWSAEELSKFKNHIAQVNTQAGDKKLMVATKSYVYLMAINRGMVIDTEGYGRRLWNDPKGFPERGVQKVPKECYIAVIPIIRVWYEFDSKGPFTVFLNSAERPRVLLRTETMSARYGDRAAAEIMQRFDAAKNSLNGNMTVSWTSAGAINRQNDRGTTLATTLAAYPVPDFAIKGIKLSSSWR